MKIKNKIALAACGLVLASAGFCGNVFAEHDTFFDEWLSADGKFVIKSVEPTDMDSYYTIADYVYEKTDGVQMGDCDETYTNCLFSYRVWNQESMSFTEVHEERFDVKYDYDATVKARIDVMMAGVTLPDDGFFLNDMELINYFVFHEEGDLPNYSSELRSAFGNANLNFWIDVRAGGDGTLETSQAGIGKTFYDGVLYYTIPFVNVTANHILYVPSDTADSKIVETLQARIDATLKAIDGVEVTVRATDKTVADVVEEGEHYDFAVGSDKVYKVFFKYADNPGRNHDAYFVVKKDSNKIPAAAVFDSKDLATGISIVATDAAGLPGNLLAMVESLGSASAEVEEALGKDKAFSYDLGLSYSGGAIDMKSDYGYEFKVGIPVPAELKGKDLAVYYIDADGKIEEHPAEVVGDVANFETTHFSVYILAGDEIEVPKVPDTGAASANLYSGLWSVIQL